VCGICFGVGYGLVSVYKFFLKSDVVGRELAFKIFGPYSFEWTLKRF